MFTYTSWGYNYGILGTIIFILIWVIIIGVIIEVLRAIFSPHRPPAPRPPAPPVPTTILPPAQKSSLDILNERYAKGEINKEEYDQKRSDITNSSHN